MMRRGPYLTEMIGSASQSVLDAYAIATFAGATGLRDSRGIDTERQKVVGSGLASHVASREELNADVG